jgi:hypothetical protein
MSRVHLVEKAMPFKTSCPACTNSLQIPDAAAGKRGKCPACGHIWLIPQPAAAIPTFSAACPACNNPLQVPGAAVGKRAKCPVCQHVWVIPRPLVAAAIAEKPKTWFDEALDETHPATSSPAAAAKKPAAPRPREAAKLWRDGKLLVIDIDTCEFPAYCVKTGNPTTARHRIELAWVDRSRTWGVSTWGLLGLFGPLGRSVGRVIVMREIEKMKTKFSLRVGLSPEWLFRRRIRRWISWAVMAGGVTMAIIGGWTIQYVPSPGKQPVKLSLGMLAGCVIAVIGWMMFDYTRDRSVLGVQTMDKKHAWLVGVHRSFLDRLDSWK